MGKLLEEDQKIQMVQYKKHRKKQEANNQLGLKQLKGVAKTKSELKKMQADSRAKFQEVQQDMDREFDESLVKQKQEEAEAIATAEPTGRGGGVGPAAPYGAA